MSARTVLANAKAIGSAKPIDRVDSTLLAHLGSGEQRAVIAHELAHILSDHVLYMTALNILLSVGGGMPLFLGIPSARSGPCCSSGPGRPS